MEFKLIWFVPLEAETIGLILHMWDLGSSLIFQIERFSSPPTHPTLF